jgi:2-dehydro-3-deoxyphosphogluconate aldolase / (4S)-4-hydroxy-2-oxoglutarate aldolase
LNYETIIGLTMQKILEEIESLGIVPVITIEKSEDAEPLAQALIDGGLPCAEIALRTPAASESITKISKAFPEMLLGAGTVLTVDQVKMAIGNGAKFIVSPGINRKVVEYCLANNIPITPGVATPSEIEVALEIGLEVVKFFPAEANGGLEFLKAMSAPYKQIAFIPTGGIDEKNLVSYLKFPRTLACGGSWMVKSDLINGKNFTEIKRLTNQAVMLMLGFDLRHLGINTPNADHAARAASQLQQTFGFAEKDTPGSIFVGTQFELLKRTMYGDHGHIAISTNFIERAIAHLGRKGVRIKPETKNEKDGKLQTVYLDLNVEGFAFHLVQV